MTDLEEINAIIKESGNSFHCKVCNYLKEKGWHTLVSPYYMDSSSNKPREIDLVAEKSWHYNASYGNNRHGTINLKLFIECKYIPQKNVFWFSKKDILSAKEWVTSNTPLPKNNMFTDQHHYLATNPKVAKLFASKNKSGIENEVIYKALNQSLNAMVYLRGKESIIPKLPDRKYNILHTVEIPVILCNSFDNFYFVDMENTKIPHKINDNFQLEINYAYLDYQKNHRSEFFLIDVVDYNQLDGFLGVLESDKDAIFQIL